MGLIQMGNFRFQWGGQGNDRFTRTPNNWVNRLFGTNNDKEQWITVVGKEAEIYNTTAEVKIVFDRFASMFSNGIYQELDAKGEVVENSEIVKRLLNPNVLLNGKSFMQECALHYLIFGNRITYTNYGSSLSEVPTALWNLPADRIKMILTGLIYEQIDIDGIIKEYYLDYDNNGTEQRKTWQPSEIIHHKNIDPLNPLKGKSVLESLHMDISNIRASKGFQNVLLTKKGAVGFYSSGRTDGQGNNLPMNEDDKIALGKQETNEYGIFDSQSAIKFTSFDVKWNPTSFPVKDMMTFETISEGMKRIIDSVQLNDNIFSKEKSKVQANLQEGLKMAYQDAIIPFSNDYCNNFSQGLRLKEGHRIALSYDHISALQKDDKTENEVKEIKARAVKTYFDAGYSKEQALKLVEETV
jgi:hypothetical protein